MSAFTHDDGKSQPYPVAADSLFNVADASKAEDKSIYEERGRYLNPHHGSNVLRVQSPDTLSELSIDDNGLLRPSRNSIQMQPLGRINSKDAPPRKALKSRLREFWARNKGLGLVLLAQVFGTLMNVTTRLLELEGNNGKGLHPFQVLFARMSITVVLASLYMWKKKIPDFPFGAREVRPLLVARGLGGFFGVFGMYYSLLYLPLADATVITFLAPSIACWACSYILKEPFTRMEQIAAYISLFGVVLIARPTSFFTRSGPSPVIDTDISAFINGTSALINGTSTLVNGTIPLSSSETYSYDHVTPKQRALAVGVAMLGVLGAACAYTTLRAIGKRAHALISVNYFATWCTIVSTVMMFALPGVGFLLPANLKEWTYLFFLGTCGFIMQFLLAAGLQHERSSRATNMVYTQMLFALTFDKLVFGTVPGWLSILGSSLILGSAIYVAVQKDTAKTGGGVANVVETEAVETEAVVDRRPDEERGLVDGMEGGEEEEEEVEMGKGGGQPRRSIEA